MKIKTTILLGLFITSVGISSQAQTYTEEVMDVTTSIASALSISNEEPLEYGQVSSYTPGIVYMDPKGIDHAYVSVNPNVGAFNLYGQSNSNIQISWESNLTLNSSTSTLNYVPAINGSTEPTQSSSNLLVPTNNSVNVSLSASGEYYLWVGGSLGGSGTTPAALSNQEVGNYAGQLTVSIAYN